MRTTSPFGAHFGPRLALARRVPLMGQSTAPACVKVTTVRSNRQIISTIIEPYQIRGDRIYNVPTGELVDAGLPTEFKVADVWACPAGLTPPGWTPPAGKEPQPIGPPATLPETAPVMAPSSEDTTGLAVGGGIIAALVAALALG